MLKTRPYTHISRFPQECVLRLPISIGTGIVLHNSPVPWNMRPQTFVLWETYSIMSRYPSTYLVTGFGIWVRIWHQQTLHVTGQSWQAQAQFEWASPQPRNHSCFLQVVQQQCQRGLCQHPPLHPPKYNLIRQKPSYVKAVWNERVTIHFGHFLCAYSWE